MAIDSLESKETVLVTFSIAVITHHDEDLRKTSLGLQFQKNNSPSWQESLAAGSRHDSWGRRAYILNPKQEAERANSKQYESLNSELAPSDILPSTKLRILNLPKLRAKYLSI